MFRLGPFMGGCEPLRLPGPPFIMRRYAPMILGLGCTLALVVACFHAVFFRGHQFAYRDSGHFYYPLYRVVQQEWEAGRWPLWNPRQNGGTPLLGMPMAAVLYPGKLIYAAMPYHLAARYYVLAHTIVALLGMLALGRALGLSAIGASIAAIGYAFGAPVLSQYSNVIFLVGAAWLPRGFRAIHRIVAMKTRWGILELAVVLALQVLGGDPEAALLDRRRRGLYAGVLAFAREHPGGDVTRSCTRVRHADADRGVRLGCPGDRGGLWRAQGRGAAWLWLSGFLGPGVGLGLVLLVSVWRSGGWRRLGPSSALRAPSPGGRRCDDVRATGVSPGILGGLVMAVLLAMALSAAQLGPTLELAARSTRMRGLSGSALYDFSVEPYRLAEAIWPHVFGLEVPENRCWIQAIPPAGERMLWSPSLYVGGIVLVLALGAAGLRGGPPWRSLVDDARGDRRDRRDGQVRGAALVGTMDSGGRRPGWDRTIRPAAPNASTGS